MRLLVGALCWCLFAVDALAYPIDGYPHSHIRRLLAAQAHAERLAPGARLPLAEVRPSGTGVDALPPRDAALSARLAAVLGEQADHYAVAVLDLSDPRAARYFGHRDEPIANVGSVGKLLVMLGLFDTLARLYPDDTAARERILRDTLVTTDEWALYDEHTVPIFDPAQGRIVTRQLRVGDTGNLWEYLDWMLSASNNGAASMAIQQIILLQRFGHDYPVAPDRARDFLAGSSPAALGALFTTAMGQSLDTLGLNPQRIRQGSAFTRNAKARVAGTSSHANPRDLVRLLNAIESGRFVDGWSSQEAKRLLYMTQRRIRYASHPVLNESAVYFKSGSLYSCQEEPGFVCRKYMGNKQNRLASVALVETPAEAPRLRYLVAVMSNVLRVNSAVAHQTLALRIHRLVEAAHRERLQREGTPIEDRPLPPARVEDAEGREP